MPKLRVEAQISVEDLLKAVEQLDEKELERLNAKVVEVQTQYKAPHLSITESELLLKINQGLSSELQQRYRELVAKRQSETLTGEEYQELLELSGQIERFEAQRLEYLVQLAQLRQTTLPGLLHDLGIHSPDYA